MPRTASTWTPDQARAMRARALDARRNRARSLDAFRQAAAAALRDSDSATRARLQDLIARTTALLPHELGTRRGAILAETLERLLAAAKHVTPRSQPRDTSASASQPAAMADSLDAPS